MRFVLGEFIWQDGTPLDVDTFHNWAVQDGVQQPDNGDGGREENCVQLLKNSYDNQWDDTKCNKKFAYICKKRPMPTSCSDGWVQNGNQCFKAYFDASNINDNPEYLSFLDAKEKCASFFPTYSTLAVPHNEEEVKLLKSLVTYNVFGQYYRSYRFWIGVERLEGLTLTDLTTGSAFKYNGSYDLPWRSVFAPYAETERYKCLSVSSGYTRPESSYDNAEFEISPHSSFTKRPFICQHPIQA